MEQIRIFDSIFLSFGAQFEFGYKLLLKNCKNGIVRQFY